MNFLTKHKKVIIAVSASLTLVIAAVMNLYLIPEIEKSTQGLRAFDMNPTGYDFNFAKQFISLLGENGKALYLNYQLPLDFVYPLCYTVLFVSLVLVLTEKARFLALLPILLCVFDYGENICILLMLKAKELSVNLVSTASVFTMFKSFTMYAVFTALAVLIVIKIVKKKSGNKKSRGKSV